MAGIDRSDIKTTLDEAPAQEKLKLAGIFFAGAMVLLVCIGWAAVLDALGFIKEHTHGSPDSFANVR